MTPDRWRGIAVASRSLWLTAARGSDDSADADAISSGARRRETMATRPASSYASPSISTPRHREDAHDAQRAVQVAGKTARRGRASSGTHRVTIVRSSASPRNRSAVSDRSQALGQEDSNRFTRAARRHEDVEQHRPARSAIAGLLEQLALRGRERVFARDVEQALPAAPTAGPRRDGGTAAPTSTCRSSSTAMMRDRTRVLPRSRARPADRRRGRQGRCGYPIPGRENASVELHDLTIGSHVAINGCTAGGSRANQQRWIMRWCRSCSADGLCPQVDR